MDRFISMWKVRELADKVTNVVMNYTEVEGKVREATSDEAWGPTGQQMQELAMATFTYEHFPEVMSMLWRRMLHDNKAHWRRTYKYLIVADPCCGQLHYSTKKGRIDSVVKQVQFLTAEAGAFAVAFHLCLLLLSYLVRNGSERVVTSAREHIYDLRSLENYSYVDELGKDQGINVRHKVRELIDFIQDDDKLREERKKAKKNKDKYIGMSSEAIVMGSRGGSGGWGEYSDRANQWDEPKERHDEDEYEREDSDGEYGRRPNKENIYRDSVEPPGSPGGGARGVGSVRVPNTEEPRSLSISLRSPAKTKQPSPIKKIDLGAAANYGKSSGTTAPPPTAATPASASQNNSQQLLDDLFKTCSPTPAEQNINIHDGRLIVEDDFDPRAEEMKTDLNKHTNEFGDFANAFAAPEPNANDGFADFSSAFNNNNNVNDNLVAPAHNTVASSNLDLLSDLSPPPLNIPNLSSTMDSLSGQLSATTLNPSIPPQGYQAFEDVKTSRQDLAATLKNLTQTIDAIGTIKSELEKDQIKKCFNSVFDCLPGPMTVQKLCKIDKEEINTEVIDLYSRALTEIAGILLYQWPVLKEHILKLFSVEENFYFIKESLTVTSEILKIEKNRIVLEALACILEEYVKSDCIFVAIVECCNVINLNDKGDVKSEWLNFVQILVTLPERIANKLEKNSPMCFSYENYSYNLIFHTVRAMDFMTESSFYQYSKYDVSCLSYLLSKLITNYGTAGNSEPVTKFINIIIGWAIGDYPDPKKFARQKLIQRMLFHLSRQAIEVLSIKILSSCPIHYGKEPQPILGIFGDNIDNSKDWNQIFCYKIHTLAVPKTIHDTVLVENLISYLSTSKKALEILSDFIIRLSTIWADVKSFNASNVVQHVFTSQLLILSVKYCCFLSKKLEIAWSTNKLKYILFKGMSKHLDSLNQEIRAAGMTALEIILAVLEPKSDENALQFDYSEMSEQSQEINRCLEEIGRKCLIDPTFIPPKKVETKHVNVKEILDFVAQKVYWNCDKFVNNTITTSAVKTQEQTKEIVKTIIADKLISLKKQQHQIMDTLDSDDDLQPYDMSNDLPLSADRRPAYLRDLIEKINEAKDFEDFEACLEVSEELVTKQLRNNDPKLAIDLLDLFVHLECKFSIDDFDSIRFNTAVAIVCARPEVCANHLCSEFHADIGRFSIATKLLMLDILSEAANRLADVRPSKDIIQKENEIITKAEENVPAEEVIRRRLINKTRYFHSKRPHPFAKAKKNIFANVSDHFFFPLVYGFGKKQLTLSYHNMKQDTDNILLLKYLSVIGNIVLASKNCPKCSKYCYEIIEIIMYLRYNSEPKIQMAVMGMVASIILALPNLILKSEFYDPMMEIRSWLTDCLTNFDLTMKLGGPKSEAAIFAGQVLYLLEKAFAEDDVGFGF
ncbi:Clathrin interactor 1 [Eumeta japonica]|uniref:Clathrin interactor 1 n=1 Tax=Eumeta variegata TaxID=151549 RepID=A0A4C1W1X8_EUMVA|nr:Clathrin interactor 1 [Eumeta japonica]